MHDFWHEGGTKCARAWEGDLGEAHSSAMVRRLASQRGAGRSTHRALGSAEQVYFSLKSRILSIELAPGASLSETDLAQQYQVSRTPVREALIRLADEGLVDVHPKSGTNVSRIPIAQLPEALVVRKALEGVTASKAAQNATASTILTLQARLMRQQEIAETGDRDAFFQADEAFHAAIAEVAGYPGIWTLVERAKMQVDRFRLLTLPQYGRMQMVIAEHSAVLDAIIQRSPEGAAAAMGRHIESLEISLADTRSLNHDYFEGDFERESTAA